MAIADDYRKQAEECRERAEKSWRPDEKQTWLKLAEKWQGLADEVDGPYRGPRP